MIDAFAAETHHLRHLLPVWRALPDPLRGTMHITSRLQAIVTPSDNATVRQLNMRNSPNPILIAAYGDYQRVNPRPVILMEHGAGQTYPTPHAHYAGGPNRERAILFINPSQRTADLNSAQYPTIPSVAVGCPALDEHLSLPIPSRTPPTIGITFHADLTVFPETRSGFSEFFPAIKLLMDAGFDVLAHAHPRLFRRAASFYDKQNIPYTSNLIDIYHRASVLVVDNSSVGFELAALHRPIVWMSPSFYRRDISLPPRFWGALVLGEHAQSPEEVPAAVTRALQPVSSELQLERDRFLTTVYAHRDGSSTQRAVEAIVAVVNGGGINL